ncbi:ABC transporter ATP-binding protein [uncultured Sphaerochaeta sp.]|uniref:ABC transporter ATP-binding protein n=1 Tax=uncultured Sphaerochaeta sp. TaxID=886478 RepID=UPI002A0A6538|nr:ABC transporter ATP-binding protein [uncultured Sphaerochaeta sp.]
MPIEMQDVSKSFAGQQILKGISLTIEDRELFGIIGPSGAGKTTLIRLLMGAIASDSGSISIYGKRIPDLSVLNEIGYMPQNDALYLDLSGYENLVFFGSMYGMKKKVLKEHIEEVLHLVELEQDLHKSVALYSGGMKKRLSLAISLLHSPRLLILDEPTVGIDPLLRKKIWDRFKQLQQEGKTIIITTHAMDEADRCDKLCLLHEGTILACGTVATLHHDSPDHTIEGLFLNEENGAS